MLHAQGVPMGFLFIILTGFLLLGQSIVVYGEIHDSRSRWRGEGVGRLLLVAVIFIGCLAVFA